MRVVHIPVRDDNYAYLLIDELSNKAAAVDPYDVSKVAATASELGAQIVAAITTHHHFDHSGGNKDFAAKYPDAPIYGSSNKIPALTHLVKDNDHLIFGNIYVRCLATPCHTQDSICYYATDSANPTQPGGVFTGDTLFIAGCGRFFEGTGDEMIKALSYLGQLPDDTIVYNGHEYTHGNLSFAKSVDPNNHAIARLSALSEQNKITTGLTTIANEKEWNVFIRLNTDAVRQATSSSPDTPQSVIIDRLREMKNSFRGCVFR